MTKRLICLLTLGLVAALTPALAEPGNSRVAASEEVVAQTEMAAAAAAPEAAVTEGATPLASQTGEVPAMAALSTPAGPLFRTVLDLPSTNLTITCVLCDTHADCQGTCSGQPAVDFVCTRVGGGCYGWGPKVCVCF